MSIHQRYLNCREKEKKKGISEIKIMKSRDAAEIHRFLEINAAVEKNNRSRGERCECWDMRRRGRE